MREFTKMEVDSPSENHDGWMPTSCEDWHGPVNSLPRRWLPNLPHQSRGEGGGAKHHRSGALYYGSCLICPAEHGADFEAVYWGESGDSGYVRIKEHFDCIERRGPKQCIFKTSPRTLSSERGRQDGLPVQSGENLQKLLDEANMGGRQDPRQQGHHRAQLQGRVDAAGHRQDRGDQRAPRPPAAARRSWGKKEEDWWAMIMGAKMEVLPNSLLKGRGSSTAMSGSSSRTMSAFW